MNEQNQRLPSDQQTSDAPPLTPGNKFIKRKLCQLQNKAYFFQGQLNPLISQNQKLKNQLTLLNKSVIHSTDLLRSLLPIGSSETRRLKLQLANIEQISEMIKQDWIFMEEQIKKKNFTIDVLENKMKSNKQQYETQFNNYKKQNEFILSEKLKIIEMLEQKTRQAEQELQKTKQKCKKDIDDIKEFYKTKIQKAQKFQKQIEIYRREVNKKYREFQKSIERLKQEINTNNLQFEQSKRNLRQIYEKLMADKLQEQAEAFNLMLKAKDQQKERLILFYQEKQQQLQKYLNQKSQLIRNLQQNQIALKKQLILKQQEIKECNSKISVLHKQIESNFTEISLLKESNTLVQNKLKLIQSQLSQNQQFYKKQLQEKTKKFLLSEKEYNKKIAKLEQNNKKLTQDLQQKTQKLKLTEKSLVTIERRFNRKLQQEQQKWAKQKFIFQQKLQQLEATVNEKETKLIQQQKNHQQKMSQFEIQKKNQLETLKKEHQKQLSSWKENSQAQLDLIKLENQRLLKEQRIKNNLEMEKLTYQWTQKFQQKDDQYNSMKQSLTLQLQQKNTLISGLESKICESQNTIKSMKSAHELQVSRITNQAKKKFQDMQRLKEEQKKKMQEQLINQMREFQDQMQKKTLEYENTLKKIQNEMMNEINMLKSSNALQEMESKYLLQMQQLRKSHQQQISTMEEKQKQSQQSLIDQQKKRIQDLILQYQEDMTKLAKKLEVDIEKLNDQLMVEQSEHQITKMTREQKIKYLSKKINDLKILSEQKQNKILELYLEIQLYKQQQQKVDQIIAQKVQQRKLQLEAQKSKFFQECQSNIEKTKLQAERKVSQIQKDRLEHTKSMYEKFNQLKEFHEEQISRIQGKYSQLQRMFSQRPSRAQDLSKIKQLIEIKQKMDIEIKTYHKKVQHANEIVKYLNMELENYKDNYDMFGPGQQNNEKNTYNQSNTIENPLQSIMKLKRINQTKLHTEGAQVFFSNRKPQNYSPKNMKRRPSIDSPQINDFQIFPQRPLNESQTIIPPGQFTSQSRLGNPRLSPQLLNKAKKGKSVDKSGEIVLNAENFLKLIKSNSKSNTPLYKDFRSNQKRAYRKSKPRRLNTLGLGSGEVFTLARRGSIQQEQR